MTQRPLEQWILLPRLLKWLLISLVVGFLAAGATYIFLKSLDWVTDYREAHLWIIVFLPAVGFVVGWTYHHLGQVVEKGNDLLIDEIHNPKRVIPLRMFPFILAATLASHLFGASVGREGTAIQMGGSLADQLTLLFKFDEDDRRVLLMAGMSAGFAAVFGTPLAGAVFALEVLAIGRMRYEAIFPCFLSAVIADQATRALGISHTAYAVTEVTKLTPMSLGATLLAGALFGIIGMIFARGTHWIGHEFRKRISYAPLRPFLGGAVVAVAVWALGTSRYIGLGIPVIREAFLSPSPVTDFSLKTIFTAMSLGAGLKGGEVTPLFYIGATLGSSLSHILPLATSLLAGIGFVAVFAGAANTPIACTIMAMELFGPQVGLYAGLACVTSYLFSGHSGIYRAQQSGHSKHGGVTVLRITVLVAAVAGLGLASMQNARAEGIASKQALAQPEIPKPAVSQALVDPVFKTTLMRITDARSAGAKGILPDYSKRQAWNSNESLLLLRTGDGNALLYDGATYKFKKALEGVGGEDVFWSPSNPSVILFSADNVLSSFNVETSEKKPLFTFPGYTYANTRGEGNLSRDGRWYAVVGQYYDEAKSHVFYRDLIVFDLTANQIAAKFPLPSNVEAFDWVSISPNGNYVVVDYADDVQGRFHGLEVYDRNFKFLWQKPLGAGHSDLGVDENGDEILVMDVYDPVKNVTVVKKFRLADGRETSLLEISPLFDQHISCRNERRAGWCFLSTFDYVGRLTDSAATWLPFEDEIFALKLDGSGTVERLAHHHSRRYSPSTPDSDHSNYFSEPHATVSRGGDRVIFGSNWRQNVKEEASVDAYVLTNQSPVKATAR